MNLKQDLPQISLEVLYKSEDLVVIRKPFACLSTPSRTANDPRPVAGLLLQQQLGCRIWPVHRLDFEVAGPMIFALNAKSHSQANIWFENSLIKKTYLAASEAQSTETDWLDWNSRLVRGKKRSFRADYGKESRTRARCLGKIEGAQQPLTLWELLPLTGRSHQLRFELSDRFGPIFGDRLYGSKTDWQPNRIALECINLDLSKIQNRFGLPERIETKASFLNELL